MPHDSLSRSLLLLLPLTAPLAAQDAAAEPEAPHGLRVRTEKAFDSYTLFAPLRSGHTFLIDMAGEVVHDWHHGLPPMSNYLLDNGHLLFLSRIDDNPVFFGGGIAGRIRELDWKGECVWEYALSTEKRMLHHDIEPLPNGNVLAIAWEYFAPAEAEALGRHPDGTDEHGFWPDVVLELEPVRPSGGKIVWEWRAAEHLIQDFEPAAPNFGDAAQHPGRIDVNFDVRANETLSEEDLRKEREREAQLRLLGYAGGTEPQPPAPDGDGPPRPGQKADWLHVNSVDYDAAHDLILLSSPNLSEVFIIDHSTTTEEARGTSGGRYGKGGDLLYRWGNPRNYGAGTEADRTLFRQHQAEWIPKGLPGAGRVTVFNNDRKTAEGVEYSSVDEFELPFDGKAFAREAGAAFGPKTAAWSYVAPNPADFHSFFISGCQRLPNGNTFICSGKTGRLFEVTPAGAIAWEYLNPFGGEIAASKGNADPNQGGPSPVELTSIFRAAKYAKDHQGLARLVLKNGE